MSPLDDAALTSPPCADCAGRAVLTRVGDRWSVLILHELSDGPRRFGQLLSALPGAVQPKVLSETLTRLERDGFVTRVVVDSRPPWVRYELSELGCGLLEPVRQLLEWAEEHSALIEKSWQSFDERAQDMAESG